jgi:hypothetical protein
MRGKKGRYYLKEEHTNYEVNKRRGTKLISNLFFAKPLMAGFSHYELPTNQRSPTGQQDKPVGGIEK